MNQLIYAFENNQYHVALLEEGELCEYFAYDKQDSSMAGAIIKGKVARFVPGMQAAFVDIGLEKNGFLPLKEGEKLQSGQEIMVQVKKDPSGSKGAFLTGSVTIPGTYMVYLPLEPFIGISKRITDENAHELLKSLAQELTQPGSGLVMRNAALEADLENLYSELETLRDEWNEIQSAYPKHNAPYILHRPLTPFEELIRDYGASRIDTLYTNVEAADGKGIPVVYSSGNSLLEQWEIPAKRSKSLRRTLWLKSGGTIVIDPCGGTRSA